jgi:hypothetical protein
LASLNLSLDWFDTPKAMQMEERLGNGADGLPIRLWTYAGRVAPETGRLKIPDGVLERVCRWWGAKGEMIAAMIEFGLLERDGDYFVVHDWLDHSGHLAAFRKRALKANRIRWARKKQMRTPTRIPKDEQKESPSSAVHSSALHSSSLKVAAQAPPLKFVKPTAQEVTAYAKSIGFRLDGERFVAHYESNGWKVGRNSMRNWKAAVVTWMKGADPGAIIQPPRPVESIPKPEDRVSHDDVKSLLASMGKGMPR